MVAITFRGSGGWGSGKGANLTPAEVDANFYALKQAVEAIAAGTDGVGIANITVSGSQFTVHLTDGSTQGPFTLPRAISTPAPLTEPDATLTLSLTENNRYVRCTHASGCTITVPTEADVAFALGAEIHFRQCSAGGLAFVAATGVTINGVDGCQKATDKQGSVVTLKYVGADEWDLFGLLAAEPGA